MAQPLFDKNISKTFASIIFSESHGAFDDHLGAGAIYYALATMIRSQVSVCIGSGGGFVPRLLRQAQLDLGLSNAQTYLIDANIPDLGFGHPMQPGGWLTPDNDLQTAVPGLTILCMLSSDAAKLLGSGGISIDYLHIDGDHSAQGVCSDVRNYLPLLSEKAVVSLHDLRLDAVRQAMSEIACEYPGLEWVTFSEVGQGTAVLRRRAEALAPSLELSLEATEDLRRVTSLSPSIIASEVERSQKKARYERWNYLATPAYRFRYDIAAKAIDAPGRTVVEIGGYPNSIVRHLDAAKRVISVEPYAAAEYLAEIQAAAQARGIDLLILQGTLGSVTLTPSLLENYALVALGLDISPGCETIEEMSAALDALAKLAGQAEIVAVETFKSVPSEVTLGCILDCIEYKIVHDIAIDFSMDPVADEFFVKDGRSKSRLLVVRPHRVLSRDHRQAFIAVAAQRLLLLKTHQDTRDYKVGETIFFKKDTDSARFLVSGWSGLEANFVWGTGTVSKVELKFAAPCDRREPLHLRLNINPFVRPAKLPYQRLAIVVNGKRLFKGRVQSDTTLTLPLDLDLLSRRQSLQIVFIHPDRAQPRALLPETSKDDRPLAIALKSLAVVSGAPV